ncbi:MAG TPA: DUF6077 domain-containing protein [Rubrobacteraceae bacterium]|nr:DUF6077 domain-containing protein [Rubrobacteraceae bacterium]
MIGYRRAKKALGRRPRALEVPVVLTSAGAMVVVGPLRGLFEAHPLVPFAGALFLFVMPGLLVSHWFFADRFSGAAMVPVAFVISAGILGLAGVPVLLAHLSFDAYLWVVGAVLAAFLAAAMVSAIRRRPPDEGGDAPRDTSGRWLWAPFVLLGAALVAACAWKMPHPYNDMWVYLAYVRDFLEAERLAVREPYFGEVTELSRAQINGWLLQQAALSRVSGIDPVVLVLDYLAPTLVFVALLAFYSLGRTLMKSEAAALLSGCLYALFFLAHLEPSVFTFGGEFVSRMAEDKFAARFLFLPVSLAFAFAFVESRSLRYLGAFAFTCWSVMTTHPVGLAIIGLCVAGFGLVHVALNWRRREAWTTMVSLAVALWSVVLVPALYVLGTGNSLTAVLSDADINSHEPEVLANMVFVKPWWKHILELEDGSYIMHPSLILNPVILAAFLLGLPFLLWRLRKSLAAQLLFGTLVLATVLVYVPPIATFVGDNIVLPGQLWRLAWPIPLAAVLTLGWVSFSATRLAERGLRGLGAPQGATRLLPLALVAGLTAAAWSPAAEGARDLYHTGDEAGPAGRSCVDQIFPWLGSALDRPSVVLAPDLENTCIPSYSADANVVSLRGGSILGVLPELEERTGGRVEVPQGVSDVRTFFNGPTDEEMVEVLRRHDADYVMVPTTSRFDKFQRSLLYKRLRSTPLFIEVNAPGQGYALFAVDKRRLDESP